MSYLNASKLTFTPAWGAMSADDRLAEQVAALELVAKYGGKIEGQWILWSDGVLLSITTYPDMASSMKAELAIGQRGAFLLQSQPALTLDEIVGFQGEIAGA
jgi:uncharacterized protein with GYD domain